MYKLHAVALRLAMNGQTGHSLLQCIMQYNISSIHIRSDVVIKAGHHNAWQPPTYARITFKIDSFVLFLPHKIIYALHKCDL